MNTTHSRRLGAVTLLGLVGLLVAACTPQQGDLGDQLFPHGKWEQITSSPDNMVEVVTLRHAVAFEPGQSGLTDAERGRLMAFTQDSDLGPSEEIVLDARREAGGGYNAMSVARLVTVKTAIAQLGLVAAEVEALARATTPGRADSDRVTVHVTRAVVVPPDCAQPQPGQGLRPDFVPGCAVNASLGLMVATPQDLVRGQNLGPGDGEAASLSMQRYRTDKVKTLEIVETK